MVESETGKGTITEQGKTAMNDHFMRQKKEYRMSRAVSNTAGHHMDPPVSG
ncbi:MAG: hypothetical protein ACE5ID_04275 [Acidobacteriota bacterium]